MAKRAMRRGGDRGSFFFRPILFLAAFVAAWERHSFVTALMNGPRLLTFRQSSSRFVRMDFDTTDSLDFGSVALKPSQPPPDRDGGGEQEEQPDEAQRMAIMSTEPAVLVVAGPGSGKTRVLSSRLAYLLLSGKCSPSEILVISFTNSAANNLCAKASQMLRDSVATTSGVQSDTFHGFCSSVIRMHMPSTSISRKNLIIANDDDQMQIMMAILAEKGLAQSRGRAQEALRQIRFWKELGLGYLGVRRNTLTSEVEKKAYELYPDYQARLKSLNALDFGDLLLDTLRIFRQQPEVLEMYRRRCRHILVDEFQDISPAQYDILRMLVLGSTSSLNQPSLAISSSSAGDETDDFYSSGDDAERGDAESRIQLNEDAAYKSSPKHTVNVFCAGDDDQSIYSWRGAQIELMRRFRFDFPGSQIVRFDISYRMPDSLCIASSHLLSELPGRIGKVLNSRFTDLSHQILAPSNDANLIAKAARIARILPTESSSSTAAYTTANKTASNITAQTVLVRKNTHEEQEVQAIVDYVKGKRSKHEARDRSCILPSLPTMPAGVDDYDNDDEIKELSIAVLARTVSDVTRITNELTKNGIPFKSRGHGAWILPAGGKAPLHLLRLLAVPDDDVAFELAVDNDIIRAANVSEAEVAQFIMPAIRLVSKLRRTSLLTAARECILTQKISDKYAIAMSRFLQKFDAWGSDYKRYYRKGEAAQKTIYNILKAAYFNRQDPQIVKAIEELSRSIQSFESLDKFFSVIRSDGDYVVEDAAGGQISVNEADDLEMVSLWANAVGAHMVEGEHTIPIKQPNVNPVTVWVMSMYAAKGLEFDEVLLPFWVEGKVPMNDSPEERRVAFVSLTRAKRRVIISYSMRDQKSSSGKEQQPSRLALELLDLREPLVYFEDASTIERLTKRVKKDASPTPKKILGATNILRPNMNSAEQLSNFLDPHPFLSREMMNVMSAKGVEIMSDSQAAASLSTKQTKSRAKPSAGISATTTAIKPTPKPRAPRAKKAKAIAAGLAPPQALPEASALTPEEINRLVYDSPHKATALKELFRVALAGLGVVRGTIVVDSVGTTKAMSKCTAEELGNHLQRLKTNNKL